MVSGPAVKAPRLVLRLPGTWVQLDPSRPDLTDTRIRAFVRSSIGRADALASARADMRRALALMLERADPVAALESAFVCHEVSPGVPTPLAVSVFTPDAIHMSPVVGTRPEDVIAGFVAAMGAIGDADGWHVLPCVDGIAARRWRVTQTAVAEGLEDVPLRSFTADYWRTVPGSKRLVLVNVTSPLADLEQTLLRLADAVVAGSRFAGVEFTRATSPVDCP
ncbi:MAG: hypothetical protein HGA51_04625 [Demequinaceae bacterium]|nr:hypothetical protein [Demequinaceae bacterium]